MWCILNCVKIAVFHVQETAAKYARLLGAKSSVLISIVKDYWQQIQEHGQNKGQKQNKTHDDIVSL